VTINALFRTNLTLFADVGRFVKFRYTIPLIKIKGVSKFIPGPPPTVSSFITTFPAETPV